MEKKILNEIEIKNKSKFFQFEKFFEKIEDTNAQFSNGPLISFNELRLIKDDYNVKEIYIEVDYDYNNEIDFNQLTLWIELPKKITSNLLVEICNMKPDEISEDYDNFLRLWWD